MVVISVSHVLLVVRATSNWIFHCQSAPTKHNKPHTHTVACNFKEINGFFQHLPLFPLLCAWKCPTLIFILNALSLNLRCLSLASHALHESGALLYRLLWFCTPPSRKWQPKAAGRLAQQQLLPHALRCTTADSLHADSFGCRSLVRALCFLQSRQCGRQLLGVPAQRLRHTRFRFQRIAKRCVHVSLLLTMWTGGGDS